MNIRIPTTPFSVVCALAVLAGVALAFVPANAGDASTPGRQADVPAPTGTNGLTAAEESSITDWSDLKHSTYDTRVKLFEGLIRLNAKVNQQVAELTVKRAAMTSTANTQNWDLAMKEMENARAYLKASGEEMAVATSANWTQRMDKVGRAWERTQDAYSKVKASTTS